MWVHIQGCLRSHLSSTSRDASTDSGQASKSKELSIVLLAKQSFLNPMCWTLRQLHNLGAFSPFSENTLQHPSQWSTSENVFQKNVDHQKGRAWGILPHNDVCGRHFWSTSLTSYIDLLKPAKAPAAWASWFLCSADNILLLGSSKEVPLQTFSPL